MPEKKDYAQDVQRLSDYLIREYTEETIKKDSKINRLNFLTKCVIEQKVNLENINEGIEKLKFDDRGLSSKCRELMKWRITKEQSLKGKNTAVQFNRS